MANGDIYELIARQHVVSKPEEILNIFHFRQTSADGGSEDLAFTFESELLEAIRLIQSPKIEYTGLSVRNLFTVDDFHERTYAAGDVLGTSSAGDMLPIHDAITFRLVRTSREVRNGFKRFAGIPESVTADGLVTDAGYITNLQAVEDALVAEMSTSGGTYNLVVLKRILDPDPTPVGEKPRYRLPISSAEAVYSDPSFALVNLFVRHQTSRGN